MLVHILPLNVLINKLLTFFTFEAIKLTKSAGMLSQVVL